MLEKAEELNITNQNRMEMEKEHENAIKNTIVKYKDIIFDADTPIFIKCLGELKKQLVIN